MPISIACMFAAFAFSNAGAMVHKRLNTPTWLIAVLTPAFLGIYVLAILAMPFRGVLTELPLVLLATVAASGPVALMHRANEKILAEREAKKAGGHAVEFRGGVKAVRSTFNLGAVLVLGLLMPTMAITMFTLVSRINYASWLNWSCDGQVLQVTRNRGNHNAPMILVETDGSTESFTQVDGGLWSQAKAGQRLKKVAGSPMAELDGQPVRMVPLQVNWWNDAK